MRRMETGMFQSPVFRTSTELASLYVVCGLQTKKGHQHLATCLRDNLQSKKFYPTNVWTIRHTQLTWKVFQATPFQAGVQGHL